jgi:hypothetical protein
MEVISVGSSPPFGVLTPTSEPTTWPPAPCRGERRRLLSGSAARHRGEYVGEGVALPRDCVVVDRDVDLRLALGEVLAGEAGLSSLITVGLSAWATSARSPAGSPSATAMPRVVSGRSPHLMPLTGRSQAIAPFAAEEGRELKRAY